VDKRPRASAGYVIKAHQYFTHRKRLRLDDAFRARWALWWGEHCALLGDCCACLLWQLPPNFENSAENFARLRDALLSEDTSPVAATRRAAGGAAASPRCAIEFRHASWHCEPVYAALRAADWCLVTTVQNNATRWAGDLASGATPALRASVTAEGAAIALPVLTCEWGAYVRFHGGAGQYEGRHGDAAMREWAARVAALLRRDAQRTIFACFNNTDDAAPPSAVQDARALAAELRRLGCME
jgi:uncharacterized protein YecE (DUF72 family)